jgi:hypothetical protein
MSCVSFNDLGKSVNSSGQRNTLPTKNHRVVEMKLLRAGSQTIWPMGADSSLQFRNCNASLIRDVSARKERGKTLKIKPSKILKQGLWISKYKYERR